MSALRREEILGLPLPITSPDEIADPTSYLAMAQARHHAQVHLRRPFEPAAVRWKVQSVGDGYGIVVAYIDARLVSERLNAVVGGEWEDDYRAHGQNVEECALTVLGRTRKDVGTAGGFEAAKSARSDALKRTAVKFGVGVSIYAMKSVMMDATPGKQPVLGESPKYLTHLKKTTKNNRDVWSARLSDAGAEWLASRYGRWLELKGEELFGPVLGHGDDMGAQGLEGEEQAPAPVDVESAGGGPALDDELAAGLIGRIEAAYLAIKQMRPQQILAGAHRARLDGAVSSHEALEVYAVELEEMRAAMEAARAKAKPAKRAAP